MKKLICLFLSLLLVLCLAACDQPAEDPVKPSASDPAPTDPVVEAPTNAVTPTDPTEPEDTTVPTAQEVEEDDLPLEIYAGVYRLDAESSEEMHCVEVFDLGNMLVLEHALYMEGSLYSFWVEEFWPNDQVEWNDLYDPMPGMSRTFSIMTSETQYDDAPRDCSLRFHDSGIAIAWNDGEVIEYYLMDEQAVSIHTNTETFQSQLAGAGAPGGEPAGRWYSWNGYTFILAEFNLDGSFRWIFKEMSKPIQVYQGAWTNTDGRIRTISEKLGAGGYPYAIDMLWEYSGEKGDLCLKEEEPLLLACFGGTDYFYPTDNMLTVPFYQSEALQSEAMG